MRLFNARACGRLGAILVLAGAFLAAAGVEKAFADDDPPPSIFWGGSEPLPRDPWYVSTDAVAMQRLFSGLGPAATLGAATGALALSQGTLALSHQSFNDPFQAGFQILVGHTFADSPYQAEVSYFWLNPMDVTAQASATTNNLDSPFTNFGNPLTNNLVDNNSLVTIHEISRLEGGEVNLKHQLRLPDGDPTIVFLVGVRHIGLRENFDYSSVPTIGGNPPVSVQAHTNNNIWGPQVGGLVDYGHDGVWLRVEGKAAICDNQADRALNANIGGTDAVHPRSTNSGTATVGDLRAVILWRPTAALTARIGYQAVWIDQVALASRNFSSDVGTLQNAAAEPPINQRGTLIYHGPFAGLQLSW